RWWHCGDFFPRSGHAEGEQQAERGDGVCFHRGSSGWLEMSGNDDDLSGFDSTEDFSRLTGDASAIDRAAFGVSIGEFHFDGPALAAVSECFDRDGEGGGIFVGGDVYGDGRTWCDGGFLRPVRVQVGTVVSVGAWGVG